MPRIQIITSLLSTGTIWSVARNFDTSPVIIGAAETAHLKLAHAEISDRHAEITVEPRRATIRRLPGAAKLWVDGIPLRAEGRASLASGSTIIAGPFRLEVHLQSLDQVASAGRVPVEVDDDEPLALSQTLSLSLSSPVDDSDEIPAREILILFASALVILRKYVGTLGPWKLCTFSEPHEIVDYLMDPLGTDRASELGHVLAAIVTRIARLAVPGVQGAL